MVKVAQLLGDYDPFGVSSEIAERIVGEIRRLMSLDLDEIDIATQVEIYSHSLDQEEYQAAWRLLGSTERASWKKFECYEEWLRNDEWLRMKKATRVD